MIFRLADQLKELFGKDIGDLCPDADDLGLAFTIGDDTIFVLLFAPTSMRL